MRIPFHFNPLIVYSILYFSTNTDPNFEPTADWSLQLSCSNSRGLGQHFDDFILSQGIESPITRFDLLYRWGSSLDRSTLICSLPFLLALILSRPCPVHRLLHSPPRSQAIHVFTCASMGAPAQRVLAIEGRRAKIRGRRYCCNVRLYK